MKKHLIIVFIGFLTIPVLKAQSIIDLNFLIGKWEVSEIVYPGTEKEYIEKGIRECAYVLNETYIQCTSRAKRKGKQRIYQSNINYDKASKLFLMNTTFSDYDFKAAYEIHLDSENSVLHIIPEQEKGETNFYVSRINFKNKDRLIWEGWTSDYKGTPSWKQLYIEESKRIK